MSRTRAYIVSLAFGLVAMTAASAHAGVFGVFSRDGSRYLVGRDQVCEPPADHSALPRCEKQTAKLIAELTFRKLAALQGATATHTAKAAGTAIEVYAGGTSPVVRWEAGQVVSKILAVYADEKFGLVAIEYQVRLGGRTVDQAVGLRLPAPAAAGRAKEAPPTPAASDEPVTNDKPDPEVETALDRARKLAKRKKHAQAIAALDELIASKPLPEAHYLRAVSLVALGRVDDAIAALVVIRDAPHPSAPEWMVEARFAKPFAKLRANKDFRAAVGLESGAQRERTPYERAVGLGGQWEQPAIACEAPKALLRLDRMSRKFELTLTSSCSGDVDRTRLAGHWRTSGKSKLHLTFPNQDADDEGLVCGIEVCRDAAGEDCIRCQPEPDLELLLRVVRR